MSSDYYPPGVSGNELEIIGWEHYRECSQHEDFEAPKHDSTCDSLIHGAFHFCSCGVEDDIATECVCDEITRGNAYDAACERGGV